jgi:hypothetical protein
VQYLLGHKRLAMTMNLYAKIRAGSAREAIEKLSYGSVGQKAARVVGLMQECLSGTNPAQLPLEAVAR